MVDWPLNYNFLKLRTISFLNNPRVGTWCLFWGMSPYFQGRLCILFGSIKSNRNNSQQCTKSWCIFVCQQNHKLLFLVPLHGAAKWMENYDKILSVTVTNAIYDTATDPGQTNWWKPVSAAIEESFYTVPNHKNKSKTDWTIVDFVWFKTLQKVVGSKCGLPLCPSILMSSSHQFLGPVRAPVHHQVFLPHPHNPQFP